MITIIGAGAIGGVLGAYQKMSGLEVEFVDIDPVHVAKMNQTGLTIELQEKAFTVMVKAYTLADFLKRARPLKKVYLCVKAHQTREAIDSIKHLLQADSYVVSFQNGLNEDVLAEIIGPEMVVGSFVNFFADYLAPGVISYGGKGSLYIGELSGEISDRIKAIQADLRPWGEVQVTDNIYGYLWSKLAYAAILMASALTNETIADFLENPNYQEVVFDLAAEVLEVAAAKNIQPLPFDDWHPHWAYPVAERNWSQLKKEVALHAQRLRSYTKTRTGIWRDIAVRKRKTEVVEQMSPIVKEAARLKVEVPLLTCLIELFSEIDAGQRGLGLENIAVLQGVHQAKLKQG